MTKKRKIDLISLCLNGLIALLVLIGFILLFITGDGFSAFKMFTILSNLYVGLATIGMFVFQLRHYLNEKAEIPSWIKVIKFTAVVAVFITFIVVITFLTPTMAGKDDGSVAMLYKGSNLFFHIIVPIFSIGNFALEYEPRLKFKDTFFAVIPVVAYGFFYIINFYAKGVSAADFSKDAPYDWYGLIGDGSALRIIIVILIFIVGSYLLGLIFFLYNLIFRHIIVGYDNDEGELLEVEVEDSSSEEPEENETVEQTKQEESIEVKEEIDETSKTKTTTKGGNNKYKDGARTYHIGRHLISGKWQVKLANGEKAIKLFDTQKEAIDYAKGLVKTQGGSIRIHSKVGKIRKG